MGESGHEGAVGAFAEMGDDGDARAPAWGNLREVQQRLEVIASRRLQAPLTLGEWLEYKNLCKLEETLLGRTSEPSGDEPPR